MGKIQISEVLFISFIRGYFLTRRARLPTLRANNGFHKEDLQQGSDWFCLESGAQVCNQLLSPSVELAARLRSCILAHFDELEPMTDAALLKQSSRYFSLDSPVTER